MTRRIPEHTGSWLYIHTLHTREFRKQRSKNRVRDRIAKASRGRNRA